MDWHINVHKRDGNWHVNYHGVSQYNQWDVFDETFKTKRQADIFAADIFKQIAIRHKLICQTTGWDFNIK